MSREIIVTATAQGRADAVIAELTPSLTRSAAQRLIEGGHVSAGGKTIKKNYRVTVGESLLVTLPVLHDTELLPQNIPLEVIYEDGDVIVVSKPRGLVVHPAPGHPDGTLVNALMYHCGDSLSGIGGEKRPGIVHRIDKDTSGLLIVAKNDSAHVHLSAQLADRSLRREYEAVVNGRVKADEGIIDAPIGRHPKDRKRMAILRSGGRNAVTKYSVIDRYPRHSHVKCILETGRTHQIRVHMESIGHPVLGDMAYGRKKPEKGLEGQCLHARRLSFIHPRTGESISLESELPGYFTDVLARLGSSDRIYGKDGMP